MPDHKYNILSDVDASTLDQSKYLEMRQLFNRAPLIYKVGNSTLHLQHKFVTFIAFAGVLVLIVLFVAVPSYSVNNVNLTTNLLSHGEEHGHRHSISKNWFTYYNNTYPLSAPIYSARGFVKYRIAVISDLDENSMHVKEKFTWISYLKKGYLTINLDSNTVSGIDWDDDVITLSTHMSYGGRGMELSELIVFNGKLYSIDDRTGIVYEIDLGSNVAMPWVILADGNGKEAKGIKGEWCTVKDETLIVGGLGKEWTSKTGELINHNPQWVKTISTQGYVQHHDWTSNYEKLRESDNIKFPGYMIHESCFWSNILQLWLFLPRRASMEKYDDEEDEHKGTNLLLQASEGFENVKVTRVGDIDPTHGFSSFKAIPGTKDTLFIALKTMETDGKVASYVMVFNLKGEIIYPEKKIGDLKFEGIEFI